MKKSGLIMIFLFLAMFSKAASLQGEVSLKLEKEARFTKSFGDQLAVTTQWYMGEFFGKETLFAGISVKNKTAKPYTFQYFVAFYDKDHKFVACAAQGSFEDSGLPPGENTQMGSCLIHLPLATLLTIKFYDIQFYEFEAVKKK